MSEATKEALKGAYETDPGSGEERDGYLKNAGIKTYLIVERVCTVQTILFINFLLIFLGKEIR